MPGFESDDDSDDADDAEPKEDTGRVVTLSTMDDVLGSNGTKKRNT